MVINWKLGKVLSKNTYLSKCHYIMLVDVMSMFNMDLLSEDQGEVYMGKTDMQCI